MKRKLLCKPAAKVNDFKKVITYGNRECGWGCSGSQNEVCGWDC